MVRFPGYAASLAPTTLPCPPPVPGSALALLVPGRSLGGGGEDWRVREADRRRGLWGAEDYKRTHPARGRCPLGPAPTRSGLRVSELIVPGLWGAPWVCGLGWAGVDALQGWGLPEAWGLV